MAGSNPWGPNFASARGRKEPRVAGTNLPQHHALSTPCPPSPAPCTERSFLPNMAGGLPGLSVLVTAPTQPTHLQLSHNDPQSRPGLGMGYGKGPCIPCPGLGVKKSRLSRTLPRASFCPGV